MKLYFASLIGVSLISLIIFIVEQTVSYFLNSLINCLVYKMSEKLEKNVKQCFPTPKIMI